MNQQVKLRQVLLLAVLLLTALGTSQARATESPTESEFPIYLPIIVRGGTSIPPGGSQARIYAYSDAVVLPPNEQLKPLLVAQKSLLCQAVAAPQTLTMAQAVNNGWAYLEQQVGASFLETFRNSADVATPEAAQAFAMAAMADSRPDGALAALLHAHELEPQSPLILVNAAGLLASLNLPNEALALLDASATVPGEMGTPMGIPGGEMATNTRGFALLALGQWAQAEGVLRPLAEGSTQLSEARLNLSQALLCQNKDDEAMRFYRLGSRRLKHDVVEHGEEVEEIRIAVEHTLDRSAGKQFTLPPLGVMNTTEAAFSVWEHTQELITQEIERGVELDALVEANSELRQARPLPSPISLARFSNIYITAMRAPFEPEIEALYQAAADQHTAITRLENEHGQEFLDLGEQYPEWEALTAACRGLLTNHLQEWLGEYYEFENLLELYTAAKYEAMTGAAANLADPLNHEFVSLLIESEMNTDVAWRLHVLNSYAGTIWSHLEFCEGVLQPTPQESSDAEYEWSARCPDALTRNKLGITFMSMVQVKSNCDTFEVEVAGPGLLTGFGQVTLDLKNKNTTFFAGAKIKGPLGLGELSVNEGFYLRIGEKGITDLGMKVSTGAEVKAGQFSGIVDGPGMEFGVAPAVEYLSGLVAP